MKKAKKRNITERKFDSIFQDKSLYNAFENYLKSRNSAQWLYFNEEYENYAKYPNKRTLPNLNNLCNTYVFSDSTSETDKISKIYISDKKIMDNLKSSIYSGQQSQIWSTIQQIHARVQIVLKQYWFEFCYEAQSQTPLFAKFNDLFSLSEQDRLNSKLPPDLLKGIEFSIQMSNFQTMKNNETLIKEAQKIWQTFNKDLQSFIPEDELVKYTNRIRIMLVKGIYSSSMFEELARTFKKRLFLLYVSISTASTDVSKVDRADSLTGTAELWTSSKPRKTTTTKRL